MSRVSRLPHPTRARNAAMLTVGYAYCPERELVRCAPYELRMWRDLRELATVDA